MIPILIALTALAGQLAYWLLFRKGFAKARAGASHGAAAVPVSIIVAARDEETAITPLLDSLANQSHDSTTVIVVDDDSSDGTSDLVGRTLPDATLLRVHDPVYPRKKHALELGIRSAQSDVLLFTDADCIPRKSWAAEMSRYHSATDSIGSTGDDRERVVVGYSPFAGSARERSTLLNRFARYETFIAGFAAAAAIGLGQPYTAVGRNLSYRKSSFTRNGGFDHSRQSLSGDDDLLVQHLAKDPAIEVVHAFGGQTYVPSAAPATWSEWLRQKLRHTSASRYYSRTVNMHMVAYHLSATIVWLSPLFAGWYGVAALVLRLAAQRVALKEAAEVLNESDLMIAYPLYEFLYFVYNAAIAPIGVLKKPRTW